MNARLVVAIMGYLFQILLLLGIRTFHFLEKKKHIRCKRLRHDYAHLHTRYKEKNFPFAMEFGIYVFFVINCAENGNFKRQYESHVSHCYAILQNLSTLVIVEILR